MYFCWDYFSLEVIWQLYSLEHASCHGQHASILSFKKVIVKRCVKSYYFMLNSLFLTELYKISWSIFTSSISSQSFDVTFGMFLTTNLNFSNLVNTSLFFSIKQIHIYLVSSLRLENNNYLLLTLLQMTNIPMNEQSTISALTS